MGKINGQEHVDKTKFCKNLNFFSPIHLNTFLLYFKWEMIRVQYEDESPKKAVAHFI